MDVTLDLPPGPPLGRPTRPTRLTPSESAAVHLELSRLLDDLERHHPALSAPLRLTLLRARRHDGTWLDAAAFRAAVDRLAS